MIDPMNLIREKPDYEDYPKLSGPALVVGGGPSIIPWLETTHFEGVVIGTNEAWRYTKLDCLVTSDNRYSIWASIPGSLHERSKLPVDPPRDIPWFFLDPADWWPITFHPWRMIRVDSDLQNTGLTALIFAHESGCDPIYCIGFDGGNESVNRDPDIEYQYEGLPEALLSLDFPIKSLTPTTYEAFA